MACPFDLMRSRSRNCRGEPSNQAGHAARAPRPIGAEDGNLDRREVARRRIAADRVAKVRQGRPRVFPGHPPPLLWKGVPRASAATVGVGGAQQCLSGVAWSATQRERSDLEQRRDLRSSRRVASKSPWELMRDDHSHQLWPAHCEVDGDCGPGARSDDDGRLGSQRLENSCSIGRVGRDRADRVAAGACVPSTVVDDHSSDPGEVNDPRAPG